MENCNNCIVVNTLKEQVKDLQEDNKTIKGELSDLKTLVATEKERVNNIFSILGEIKQSIDKIATQIDAIRIKPGNRWEMVVTEVIKYIVILAAGLLIGKKV